MSLKTPGLVIAAILLAACGAKQEKTPIAATAPADTSMASADAKANAQKVRIPTIAASSNLDFEGTAGTDGFPAAWGGGGLGYLFAASSDAPHGGKASVEMKWNRATAPDSNDWATLTQCVPGSDWKGKRLQLTGFVKTAAVDTGAGLWLRVDTTMTHGDPAAFDNMLDRPIVGTTDWKSYSVVLDIDPKVVDVCYGAVMVGRGTLWADDLSLKVVGKEVPVTAKPEPAAKPK